MIDSYPEYISYFSISEFQHFRILPPLALLAYELFKAFYLAPPPISYFPHFKIFAFQNLRVLLSSFPPFHLSAFQHFRIFPPNSPSPTTLPALLA